ncbi:MAG: multicopper oxidase domain-containing protein [Betaproteobacteria bacterium]|nr:multicopper oxidase domain-containing protein [Betaproteobacteria bacterium]
MSKKIGKRFGCAAAGAIALALLAAVVPTAHAQSFRVQCPSSTLLHPLVAPTADNPTGANPSIKCQQVSGGDGYATMGDGTQTYTFSFGPLSGITDLLAGKPGTQTSAEFNKPYFPDPAQPNFPDPAHPVNNGAVTDPAVIMNTGVLYGNTPAPMMAIDEDDEFYLTLTNVGMIMRPDLFEQHTIHFHGYPNAASFFDGVPDASAAINIGGSFTYYYLAPDAGTYFWHCHITPPEHLQMGMVGQLFVRPRQNKVTGDLGQALFAANKRAPGGDGVNCSDILCTGQTPLPATADKTNGTTGVIGTAGTKKYAYNDGDGSTEYDVDYPLQLHGFDPNFHFVGMTFNAEPFADMKDKYFLINGRSYPDTVSAGPLATEDSDGQSRPAQPLNALISIDSTKGQYRALLRISDLNVTEFHTLATVGVPMHVIADNARLLRDTAGNDMTYYTNSITLGGGESTDVILDVSGSQYDVCRTNGTGCTFFLYTTNLDHLSNDNENFGGMMTQIVVK